MSLTYYDYFEYNDCFAIVSHTPICINQICIIMPHVIRKEIMWDPCCIPLIILTHLDPTFSIITLLSVQSF